MAGAWLRDLRHGARRLRRTPAFTAIAVLTLAVGIGANTAMFSVLWNALLRALPYAEPGNLVLLSNSIPLASVASFPLSPPEFEAYRAGSRSFAGLAAMEAGNFVLEGQGEGESEPERLPGTSVSVEFFPLLGVAPLLGRSLQPDDFSADAEPAVVLGHGLWLRRFGGEPGIVGRKLTINGRPRTVLGVMPRRFDFPEETQVWGRLDAPPALLTAQGLGRQQWRVLGRLRSGVPLPAAQAEMDAVAGAFHSQHPEFYSGSPWRLTLKPLAAQLLGGARAPLFALSGAVAVLLLVACANLAGLMLVRAEGRRRELAIRVSLGASGGRIARQLLAESLLIAALGGALGVVLAFWTRDALLALVPAALPRRGEIGLDGVVLLVSAATTIFAGLLFGLVPAASAARTDPRSWLMEGGRGSVGGRRRAGAALAAAQIALSVVLLVGAGLLVRSLDKVLSVPPGFEPDGLMTFQLSPSGARYPTQPREAELYDRLLERVRALPSVAAAAAVTSSPLSGRSHRAAFTVEGLKEEERGTLTNLHYRLATPGYFSAMAIPLLRGRDLDARDGEAAVRVAVVNRALAERFWPGGDPIGHRISLTGADADALWHEIVGVVGNVKHLGLDAETGLEAFFPYAQPPISGGARGAVVMVRSSGGDLGPLVAGVRRAMAELDPALPLYNVRTMEEQVAASVAGRRFPMRVLVFFAFVALILAVVGVYGVIAESVVRRTREVGVRVALGARRSDVFALVLRQGALVVAVGTGVGLVAALAGGRLLRSLLFEVGAADTATLVAVTALLAIAALAACAVPAVRALRIDPITALRED